MNFTLLHWEMCKVINDRSQNPKMYIKVTLLLMTSTYGNYQICGLSYLRSILFGHSKWQACGLQSLDVKDFEKRQSTVKTASRNQPDI